MGTREERPIKEDIMVIQIENNDDLDQRVTRESDKKLVDSENILKKESTRLPNKLVMQSEEKRIVIDDSKRFGLSNWKDRVEINQA